MLNSLLSFSLAIHYAVPVQPLIHYSYGLHVQASRGYFGMSLFRMGSSGGYAFTSLSAGGRYAYRALYVGLEVGLYMREMGDALEASAGPSLYGGLTFGSKWKLDIGWRLFPGREQSLSFLLLGIRYSW